MRKLITKTLADPAAEEVRRSVADAIVELQGLPFADSRVIRGVVLEDTVNRTVNHKLGRPPSMVIVSPARGGSTIGNVVEVTGLAAQPKRSEAIVLQAGGYGATVTVDVTVF